MPLARFKRLQGYDTYLPDGHWTSTARRSSARPRQRASPRRRTWTRSWRQHQEALWKSMDISYDDFIRTTDERHIKTVQKIFRKLYRAGRHLQGRATRAGTARPARSFWTEHQLVDGKCPDCGRPVEKAHEESYFFKPEQVSPRA
ncbi:MAG: class I tRNA ligase family protein [Lachnospiraceae bacterium]